MEERIYLSSPHMSGMEMKYIQEAFDTNWISPLGANVTAFENEMAAYAGCKYAVALSSGTAAIHLALKAVGVGSGDIVFCSSLTFAASANPIIYQGAIPVFIDSEEKSWNMSPEALEKAFAAYTPKAVVVVNLYGQSADMDDILSICDRYGTPVIEDAAESLGAVYKGKKSGTLGKIGIYSFNGNKIITTSGGGMIVTDDEMVAKKALFWATQSREPLPWYEHRELGYNYRLSNICAGIGRGQLTVLPERILKKKAIFEHYRRRFTGRPLQMAPVAGWGEPNYWLSCVTLEKDSGVTPMEVIKRLDAENIEARPLWKPMHLQPFFSPYEYFTADAQSLSDRLFAEGLCLPSDTKMNEDDLERVCDIVLSMWK